jgi:Amt family ammonium transporter
MLGWLIVEKLRDGHPTTLGAASGAVAGLVAITPACGFVSPLGSIAIGLIAGAVCALAVGLKYRLGYDDSLDVVGVHLVGGVTGALLIGFFGTKAVGGADGLFYGGGASLLGKQALAVAVVVAYSFVVSLGIGYVVKIVMRGVRVTPDEELEGLDSTLHAETAYEFGSVRAGAFSPSARASAESASTTTKAGVL